MDALQPIAREVDQPQQPVAARQQNSTWKKLRMLGKKALQGVAETFVRMSACIANCCREGFDIGEERVVVRPGPIRRGVNHERVQRRMYARLQAQMI